MENDRNLRAVSPIEIASTMRHIVEASAAINEEVFYASVEDRRVLRRISELLEDMARNDSEALASRRR